MAPHDKIGNLADLLVSETLVKSPRAVVERRYKQEHVGKFAKDSRFGELDQQLAHAGAAHFGNDAEALDVSGEIAFQMKNDKAEDALIFNRDVDFELRILEDAEGAFVIAFRVIQGSDDAIRRAQACASSELSSVRI